MQHLKNIGGKEDNGIIYYINKDISVLMSYIITQSDHSIIEDLKEIDVMIEEVTEKTKANPEDNYATHIFKADQYLKKFCINNDIKYFILREFIYAPFGHLLL